MTQRFQAAIATLVATLLLLPATPASAETHVVKKGETLSHIATRYRCSATSIKRRNRLDSDMIRVGQRLKLPRGCDADASAGGASAGEVITHVVARGDTLGEIADLYGVTVSHLRAMNRRALGKKKVMIRVGQKLKVRPNKPQKRRHKVVYRIQAGDTLIRIAKRHGVSLKDIQRSNPKKDPNRLRIGDRIVLWLDGPESTSVAIGKPQRGRLVDGEQLPAGKGKGWYRRRPHRAWGTNETIAHLVDAFTAVRRKHPKAHDIAVGDISDKDGGRLANHKSHQNGLDVDLGFYFKGQKPAGPKAFLNALKHYLDYEANWTLITELTGTKPGKSKVSYMFVDYKVQKKLYDWAKNNKGVSDRTLEWLFQYPRGRRAMKGIIRHEPGHANHYHVRFKCARSDSECM